MEEDAGDHEIAVEAGIELDDRVGDFHGVERVLEQPADERVMKAHRRRRFAEVVHQVVIIQIRLHERARVAVLDAAAASRASLLHIAWMSLVVCGSRSPTSNVPSLRRPDLLDDELEIVLVVLDSSRSRDEADRASR